VAGGGEIAFVSKILIIEDEPDQSKLIRLRLEARGYRVISAGKAREGLDLARKERPALILMDMILPDMHGLDAAIKLKQDPETRGTPVIGISAVGSPDFIKTCLQEGIVAYVRKPYDPRELFKTIEKFAKPGLPEKGAPAAAVPPPVAHPTAPPPPAPAPNAGKTDAVRSAQKAPDYAVKLEEIVTELKKKASRSGPKKPAARGDGLLENQKIDHLIQGALGGLAVPRKERPGPSPPPPAAARPAAPPSHILIVDDDAAFIRAVTGHLSERGYEISLAIDGLRAIRQAFLKKPDLILLNLILPAGGGESVLANLRKAPETRDIPVFIMSGMLSAKMLEEKARELGAQGFISKPIEPEDLLYIIESVAGA
jgi:CheY-like chemotaxis protein